MHPCYAVCERAYGLSLVAIISEPMKTIEVGGMASNPRDMYAEFRGSSIWISLTR